MSIGSHNDSYSLVHERRLCEPRKPRVGKCLLRHRRRAADFLGCVSARSRAVGSDHDLWVKYPEKRIKISATRGSEEGINDFSLAGKIGVWNCCLALQTATGATRQWLCGDGGAAHNGSDLIKGHSEHIVQYKREPLGRIPGAEDTKKSDAHHGDQKGFP